MLRSTFVSGSFVWVVSVSLVLAVVGSVSATNYNARHDFSVNDNPNGVWSLGWSYSLGGTMTVYSDYSQDSHGRSGWRDESLYPEDDIPHVSAVHGSVFDYSYGTDELAFHPGWNDEYSIIRWTAPFAGTADVTGEFAGAHWNDKVVYVYHNSNELLKAVLPGYAVATLNRPISVAAGDAIDFAIGKVAYDNAAGTTTAVAATIDFTPVPEPSTRGLLGTAALGLLGFMSLRRKRKTATLHR